MCDDSTVEINTEDHKVRRMIYCKRSRTTSERIVRYLSIVGISACRTVGAFTHCFFQFR